MFVKAESQAIVTFTDAQREQLQRGAAALGITLETAAIDRFARFAEMLQEGNQRLNLTRVAPEDYVSRHFLDSLALATVASPQPGERLIDVGTGAGFPGLPLAIAYPELRVILLDSTRKRLQFLEDVLSALRLTNVGTLHKRAEELAPLPSHHEQYDLATARAVAKMNVLADWLLPLVRPGGKAILYKSKDAADEIAESASELVKMGSRLERIADITLPDTDVERKLVVVHKLRSLDSPSLRQKKRR